jgi:nicotinamide mononucleotide transporter
MIVEYIKTNWIEIVGAILSLIYLYLSIKAKVSLWFFGIISSVFYIVVFFDSKLYADLSLNVYYVVVSIYGWINWHSRENSDTTSLHIAPFSRKLALKLVIATLGIYIIYYLVLSKLTDSTVPKIDALDGALSIVGTWMLARKLIENWIVWIIADALCVGLYFYKGLYPTAILFIIYTLMAAVGYWEWKKNLNPE